MNPYDKAHELSKAIQSHEAYKELLQRKKDLDKSPEAKKIVQDFRKHQWEFESKRMMGQEATPEDQQIMQQLQTVLNLNPIAREYLQAEYKFGVIFQDIQQILAEAVRDVIDMPQFG